jgi:hypothetical protein
MPPRGPVHISVGARFGPLSTFQSAYWINRGLNTSYGYDSYLYNQITPFIQLPRNHIFPRFRNPG